MTKTPETRALEIVEARGLVGLMLRGLVHRHGRRWGRSSDEATPQPEGLGEPLCWACTKGDRRSVQVKRWEARPILRCQVCRDQTICREVLDA